MSVPNEQELRAQNPCDDKLTEHITASRLQVRWILAGVDDRLLVVINRRQHPITTSNEHTRLEHENFFWWQEKEMISNNPPIFSTEIAQSPQEEAEVSVLPIPYEDDPFSHACVTKRVIEQSIPV